MFEFAASMLRDVVVSYRSFLIESNIWTAKKHGDVVASIEADLRPHYV